MDASRANGLTKWRLERGSPQSVGGQEEVIDRLGVQSVVVGCVPRADSDTAFAFECSAGLAVVR
jgi:hypothetical protein